MEYLSPKGMRFSFSGWAQDSPTRCFYKQDWLGCLHGCLLTLTIINDPKLTQIEIADDGIVHELLHLASGIDICTHTTLTELRTEISELEQLCLAIKESNEN